MTRIVRICAVVLKHRLCHTARYNLIHCRNIFVQILSHDEIIESSADSCISIPVNLLLSCIRKLRWHFYFIFCCLPGISLLKSHARLAAVMFNCRTTASVASGIECVDVHKGFLALSVSHTFFSRDLSLFSRNFTYVHWNIPTFSPIRIFMFGRRYVPILKTFPRFFQKSEFRRRRTAGRPQDRA
jgi:hypothetical protein